MDTPDFDKLYDIFKDYPTKLSQVKEWEKSYRKAALVDNLYQNDAVKQLVALLSRYVADNIEVLKSQNRSDFARDELFFAARDQMLTENKCWNLLIAFFTGAQSTKQSVSDNVSETATLNSP